MNTYNIFIAPCEELSFYTFEIVKLNDYARKYIRENAEKIITMALYADLQACYEVLGKVFNDDEEFVKKAYETACKGEYQKVANMFILYWITGGKKY